MRDEDPDDDDCQEEPGIPPRIQASLDFLKFARDVETGGFDAPTGSGRELNKQELATYHSALHLLNQFFRGEVDAGTAPLFAHPPEQVPAPATTKHPAIKD